MSFSIVDDSEFYAPDLGGFGVLPVGLFLLAGGAAAGAAITSALTQGWSTGEHNYWMQFMDSTIKDWDAVGWKHSCWAKHPDERKRWLTFWNRFSTHYKRGLLADSSYVSDSDEVPAKALLKELQAWGARLNALCSAGTSPIGQDADSSGSSFDFATLLKWGTYLVAGAIGLNVIRSLKR